MARSKIWMILDKTRATCGTTWRATITSGKKTSDCLDLLLGFFLWHILSRCQGNKQLVNHFIVSLFQALGQWGRSKKRAVTSGISCERLPESVSRPPAFSNVHTEREPGTGYFIVNVPGGVVLWKRLRIRISFVVNAYLSEYSNTDESGNI